MMALVGIIDPATPSLTAPHRTPCFSLLSPRQLRNVTEAKKRELDALIHDVDLILVERRQMTREDVESEIVRELDNAWLQSSAMLKSRLERQRELELGVSRSTHSKMMAEFKAKLQQEEQAAREAAAEQKRVQKKRDSNGIFSWLSPPKRNKGGEDDSEEEDSGDDE